MQQGGGCGGGNLFLCRVLVDNVMFLVDWMWWQARHECLLGPVTITPHRITCLRWARPLTFVWLYARSCSVYIPWFVRLLVLNLCSTYIQMSSLFSFSLSLSLSTAQCCSALLDPHQNRLWLLLYAWYSTDPRGRETDFFLAATSWGHAAHSAP